jgi:hypothetical protein
MRGSKIIKTLKALEINDIAANGLRWFVIHHIESGGELPTHNKKVNLSALSILAGIDRQLFYPKRGNLGFGIIIAQINDILKNNPKENQHHGTARANKNTDKEIIGSLAAEIIELHEKLARANQIEKMALLGMHIVL